jgi:hypothetical protein
VADAEQATTLWRVQTATAGQLLARQVTVGSPGEAADLVQQLRQLRQLTLYNVESVVGASEQADGVWVLLEPIPSCTVGRLLASAEVTVAQRAILALDLLAGLAELHGAGLGHARLTERSVIVDVEGRLRLAEPWRLPGEVTDQPGEVRRASELACSILGVGPRPSGSLTPAEQQSPALVAVARSLTAGAESRASDAFQALREAAGRLAQRESLEPSRAGLSRRVKGFAGLLPAAAVPPPQPEGSASPGPAYAEAAPPPQPRSSAPPGPAYAEAAPPPPQPQSSAPPEPVPAAAAAPEGSAPAHFDDIDDEPETPRDQPPPPFPPPGFRPSYTDRRRRPGVPVLAVAVAAVAALLLILFVVVPGLVRLTQGTTQGPSSAQSQARSPAPRATAPPPQTAAPQQGGSLTGAVTGIELSPQGSCQPGARCTIRAQVNIQPPPSQAEVTWRFKVTDVCHGNTATNVPGSSVTAQAGWTFVFALTPVSLPDSGQIQVVAVTSSPADATSAPLTIGSGC